MSNMKSIVSRLRGVLGIGAIWGGLGTLVGAVAGIVAGLVEVAPLGEAIFAGAIGTGVLGLMLGTGFAGALTLAERSRTLGELTPRRAALWGGLAGAALPVVMFLASFVSPVGTRLTLAEYGLELLMGAAVYGSLSVGLAAGTVAIAKRDGGRLGRTDNTQIGAASETPTRGDPPSLPGAAL
jgi:hypothetical protein